MFRSLPKFQRFKSKRKGNIWQLFRATDFESLMYPCFAVCCILGMFPYKINALNIQICKPYYVLSTIITSVYCCYTLITMYMLNFHKEIVYAKLSLTKMLQENYFLITGGVTVAATFILSKPRMRLIQTIMELSLRLSSESYQNLSRLIHAKDIFGLIFIFMEMLIIFYSRPEDILTKMFLLYNIISLFQMDMLYMNCVCVLKACFKQINDILTNLQKLIVANDKPYHLRKTYYEQRNPFLLMNLKALQKQHLAISDTARMLKIIFSLQLLFSMTMSFTQTTFNLYFYLMQIQPGVPMKINEKQIFFNYLIESVIYGIIKLSLILWACETGKNQAVEINTTVHNVLNTTSDKQIKYEVD